MEARLAEISREEALRYMGVRGAPDDALVRDLNRCEALLRSAARPRTVWKLFRRTAEGTLEGTSFRPRGRDLARLLSGDRVILIAATLGLETEALLRRAQHASMSDALILDALASAAIESVCDRLCAELADRMAPRVLTPRFSPGYGDFPLEQQQELCRVLNVSRLLGITLSPGGLMIPQKSVTAVLGVLEQAPPQEKADCAACAFSDRCLYRREGLTCGKS